jgi:hypothetical protein
MKLSIVNCKENLQVIFKKVVSAPKNGSILLARQPVGFGEEIVALSTLQIDYGNSHLIVKFR